MKRAFLGMFAAIALTFSASAAEGVKWDPYSPYDTDIVIGSASAPITVVEYASLTCPHCARFQIESLPNFKKNWIDTGKAKLVYRHLPLDQSALAAAQAVSCLPADKQELALDALFPSVSEWAPKQDIAPIFTKTFGDAVRMADVLKCMEQTGYPEKIMKPATDAVNNGVDATPTFFVQGQKVSGFVSADVLGKTVDDKIAEELAQ